jgi:integrase
MPKITYLKEPQERIRWYTDEEQHQIIQGLVAIDKPEYAGIVRTLLDTGMRVGELFELEWSNIQDNLIVLDKTKNFSARSIPMTPSVHDIIHESDHPAGPFSWTSYYPLRTVWRKLKIHLGWQEDKQACLHACRHTFITNLVQEGINVFHVQALAGHKSLSMTKRYTHLAPDDLESCISRLASRRSGGTNPNQLDFRSRIMPE